MTASDRHVGGRSPVHVAITFPADPPADQVARLDEIGPSVEVDVVPYEEPTSFRARRRSREDLAGLALDAPALRPEQADAFAGAEVALAFDVPLDVVRVAPNLRWIQTPSTGIDQLWGSGLDRSDITVSNTVGIAAVSIAEFVMARILGIWKRFTDLDELQRRREWTPAYGRRLAGSTMVVIGLGTIGTEVATRARAFGMTVLAVRRNSGRGAGAAHEVHPPDALLTLLPRADVVVVCAPATVETEGMIDRAALRAMPRGAVLVNVGRGTHVDQDALADALRDGHLAAAAVDVAREEPLPPTSSLWDVPRLLISPHSCASLDGYWESVYDIFLDNLDRYLAGRELHHVVDVVSGYATT